MKRQTRGSVFFVGGRAIAWSILFAAAFAAAGCLPGKARTIARYERQAEEHFASGKTDEGFALLEEGLKKYPDSLPLGNTYRREIRKRKQEDRAIAFFKSASTEPDPPIETYYNLGFAYIDKIPRVGPLGAGFQSKRSIAAFQEALNREPDSWVANYAVGVNYLHWPDYFKKVDMALGYLEKCLLREGAGSAEPRHLLAYLRVGDAYARKGEVERAAKVWREGLALFPDHPDLVGRLGLDREKVVSAIKEVYVPNSSMGAIDTDLSILWASRVPESVVPLQPKTERASKT